MQQSGFFWHVHHGRILLEWCYSYDERAEYIRTNKSFHQQELRLRLFQPVKGQLPQEVVKAGNAYFEAGKAYREAAKAHNEASWRAFIKVAKAYNEAAKVYNEAAKSYNEALANHKDEIEALHALECLNCPWDGATIFSAA